MDSFDSLQLNPNVNKAIRVSGYDKPTEIQAKTIPLILEGNDIVGATETGSGKTAAFVLPALHLLAETKLQRKPRILILTPTRELASQITTAANKYGRYIKFTIASIIGGVPYYQQERMLSQPLDIIVATPGRLMDHMDKGRVDLSSIEMFVLDEADRMLDMGFIDDVKRIGKSLPKQVQTLLFTATLDKRLDKAIKELLKDPISVDLSKALLVPQQIEQQLFIANHHKQKVSFLENLLAKQPIYKAIIFSATKIGADQLAGHLRTQGHKALALHGDLNQRVRKKSLDQLREGKIQYLVATDVAARGIDIQDISHVINYDLPRCLEDYIHRVGRTGRAGRAGEAITIATQADRRYILRIEKTVGKKLRQIDFDFSEVTTPFVTEVYEKKPKKHYGKRNAGRGPRPNSESTNNQSRPKRRFNSAPKKRESQTDRGQ